MTEIFTAKTVEEAKALAAKKFGKSEKEIRFEIVDEGKKGLFGLGAKDAKVKATIASAEKKPAAPEKKAEETVKKAAPEKTVSEQPKVTLTAAAEVKKTEEKTVETAAETAPAAEVHDDDEEYSLDNFTLIEDESLVHPKVKLARDYITSILRA